jgi:hypothetical protein
MRLSATSQARRNMKLSKKSAMNKKSTVKKKSRRRQQPGGRHESVTHTPQRVPRLKQDFQPEREHTTPTVERYMLNEVEFIRMFGYRI